MTLFLEWMAREGAIVFSWWLIVTLAGAAVLPLCARLLSGLPDWGYTLSRAVGLLLVAFVFWLLAVLGFVRNTPGAMILAWLLVAVGGWVAYFTLPGERPNWNVWFRENHIVVIVGEVLFIVLLVAWALVRANNPSLVATEKPMELAFMSAVQRSETFPPNDPWMSGYAISYYHFGYIMTAMLSTLSGITSVVGFNMMIALLFALTGLNTFGVVYNLVRSHGGPSRRVLATMVGVLGMTLVLLMSNFQLPLIEYGYQNGTVSQVWLDFWDVQSRDTAPPAGAVGEDEYLVVGGEPTAIADPARWDFWWWFRASRVLNDRELPRVVDGEIVEQSVGANVIDEFPMFSFILADVHPHVLALPFAVMALGLAFNILLTGTAPRTEQVVFYGGVMGGLMFLNMWDGPIYMVVLAGAEGLRRLMRNGGRGLKGDDWVMLGLFFLSLVGLAFLLYLPFFMSFRSQASGILPNVQFPTLFQQYFIMFGPFILLLFPYVAFEAWRARSSGNWRLAGTVTLSILAVFLLLMAFLVLAGYAIPAFRDTALRYIAERGGLGNTLPLVLIKRLTHSATTVVLLVALFVVLARLFRRTGDTPPTIDANQAPYAPAAGFALLLIACAAGITLVPEFVYLRDNFGVRINTIFKFYYQAWVMFGVAAAFAVYMMTANYEGAPNLFARIGYTALLLVVLFMGLPYAFLGTYSRATVEAGRIVDAGRPLTLDGGNSLVTTDDYAAITCLADLVEGDNVVVAEAIGPAYSSEFGRVGVLTGIPIVLGWENHQRQWRGNTYNAVAGNRRLDVELMYNDPRWEIAADVIRRYDIDYIFYGSTERDGGRGQPGYSPAGEEKFIENLDVVCQRGGSLFYRVTPRALELVGANNS